jgi:hypothetical protein
MEKSGGGAGGAVGAVVDLPQPTIRLKAQSNQTGDRRGTTGVERF